MFTAEEIAEERAILAQWTPWLVDVRGLRLCLWHLSAQFLEKTTDASSEKEKVPAETKPVVLFVHGYLDGGRSFAQTAYALRDVCIPLLLDWRGHGMSECVGAGGSYHLLDHLKDLSGLLDVLAEKSTTLPPDLSVYPRILVAHSMGGNVALMLAGALPDAIDHLILVDAMGPPAEEPERQAERLGEVLQSMRHVKPFSATKSVEHACERLQYLNAGLSARGSLRIALHLRGADGVFLLDPRLRGPTSVRYPEEMWLALCARVKAKTTLIRATSGYLPPVEAGADASPETGWIGRRIASFSQIAMKEIDCSHHIHVEEPQQLAQHILDVLVGSGVVKTETTLIDSLASSVLGILLSLTNLLLFCVFCVGVLFGTTSCATVPPPAPHPFAGEWQISSYALGDTSDIFGNSVGQGGHIDAKTAESWLGQKQHYVGSAVAGPLFSCPVGLRVSYVEMPSSSFSKAPENYEYTKLMPPLSRQDVIGVYTLFCDAKRSEVVVIATETALQEIYQRRLDAVFRLTARNALP